MYEPLVRCSEIRDALMQRPMAEVWSGYIAEVRCFEQLWICITENWAERVELPDAKRDKHRTAIHGAFNLMDDWRHRRIKHIKARRNEIDSAISFVRNTAIDSRVSTLAVAPVARNLAALLRHILYISVHGFDDRQIPGLVAREIYLSALIRTWFPIDESNLISFLPAGLSLATSDTDLDHYHVMLAKAAVALGMNEEVGMINRTAATVWESFGSPLQIDLSEIDWNSHGGELSMKLYYEDMKAFHNR